MKESLVPWEMAHAATLTLGSRRVFAVAAGQFLWELRVGNVWEGLCLGRVSPEVTPHCLSLRLFWSVLSKRGLCFPFPTASWQSYRHQ